MKLNEKNTDDVGMEVCDVRLTTVELLNNETRRRELNITDPNLTVRVKDSKDIFFYRMGYFNYQKLNMKNMVQKYDIGEWYQIDILIDWGEQFLDLITKDLSK